MSNKLLPAIEINPPGIIHASVIWLHGLGADGHDFEPIVPELGVMEELGVRFILPHAPTRPVTINQGCVMRAWYDIVDPNFSSHVDEQGIRESQQLIDALVRHERDRGIPSERIILAGFSQGGVIALEVGSRYKETLGGIIALSTYIPLHKQFPDARCNQPVFMGHGIMDPVIPIFLGEQGRDTLQSKAYQVQWQTYPMQHSVCPEEITHIGKWLLSRLT